MNTAQINCSHFQEPLQHGNNSQGNQTDPSNGKNLLNDFLDNSQLVMITIGFFSNAATLLTLIRHGKGLGEKIVFLLKHQSAVDCLVCVFAGIILVSPHNWVPGVYGLDALICNVWHGQGLYWVAVYISVYNIVLIAYDRYLCVCRPFKFQDFTLCKLYKLVFIVYLLSLVCNTGSFLQTRMRENGCNSEHLWDGPSAEWFFFLFGISIFINYYLIPCTFFIVFYGMVIWTFKKRKKSPELGVAGESQVIDMATKELTKTAFVVTVIFVIALGYDCWYYLLGNLGVITYVLNSPEQKIGVWLSVFNSCANPFVYAFFIPRYRKAVSDTFCGKCRTDREEKTVSDQ